MSFQDIKIVRHMPVVNGHVAALNNLIKDKNEVTVQEALALEDTDILQLDPIGSHDTAGGKYGAQQFIEMETTLGDLQGSQIFVSDV